MLLLRAYIFARGIFFCAFKKRTPPLFIMTSCQNSTQKNNGRFANVRNKDELKDVCQRQYITHMPLNSCRDNEIQETCTQSSQEPSYSSAAWVELTEETRSSLRCLSEPKKCTLAGVTQYGNTDVSSNGQFLSLLGTEQIEQAKSTTQAFPLELEAKVRSPNGTDSVSIQEFMYFKLGDAAVPKATLEDTPFKAPRYLIPDTPVANPSRYVSNGLGNSPARDLMAVIESERAQLADAYLNEETTFEANKGAVLKVVTSE